MDILSIIGLIVAFGALIGGNMMDGGSLGSLVQLTAFVIVVGGTVGAVMLQTPSTIFLRALRMVQWIFKTPCNDPHEEIKRVLTWAHKVRREGLLDLEQIISQEQDPFTRKALSLLVDGNDPDYIRDTMELEISALEHKELQAARVFEGMGGYAPTLGIIGAVMGLIQVMHNLADPSALGEGIATAFVATVYGVAFANLVFLPIANKLKGLVLQQAQMQEIQMEGIIGIALGQHPNVIKSRLLGYCK